MNKETLELLLRQNLSTVKEFVSLMFDTLKKEVETLKNENSELKQSLMFTLAELEDLKKSSKEHSKMIANISEEDTSMSDISERLRAMEDYSRRTNIVVDGIPERNDENNEQLQASVANFFKEKLSIDPDIEVVHRIGRTLGDRPRSVMIKLRQYKHRQECLNSASKLRGTNVFLNEDVSKATMQIRKEKLPELKEKRRQGFIAYFSGSTLITKQRRKQDSERDSGSQEDNNSVSSQSGLPKSRQGKSSDGSKNQNNDLNKGYKFRSSTKK